MRRFRTDAFGMHDDPAGDWVAHAQAEYEIARRDRRIAELEAAIDHLSQCKGRYHTEANYKALVEVRNKTLHK